MKLISDFFKAYYSVQEEEYLTYYSQKDEKSNKDKYWEEVLKPSQVEDSDFVEIEEKLKVNLPNSFKNFYKSHYSFKEPNFLGEFIFEIPGSYSKIFDLTAPEVKISDNYNTEALSIVGNPEGANLKYLKEYLLEKELTTCHNLLGLGLIPFGIVHNEWHVCLDINQNKENPPITLYSISFGGEGKARSNKNWFSDFNSFLACITDYLKTGRYNGFNKIDPENNYEIIYDFWNRKKNT